MLIDALSKFLDALPKIEGINEYSGLNLIQTQDFFESLSLGEYTKDQIELMEVFCKKIEVSKKLYTHYDAKVFKPYGDQQISHDVFCRIFCHLIGAYLYTKNYKFLNTTLKVSSSALSISYWHIPLPLKVIFESLLTDD